MAKKTSSKRQLINTGTDKRYVRRDSGGKFKESDDAGRSLAQDRKQKAKTKSVKGQGIEEIGESEVVPHGRHLPSATSASHWQAAVRFAY